MYFLDQPLYFLERRHPGVSERILDPALLRVGQKRVTPLFTDESLAEVHLAKLPDDAAIQCAADYRAKEELFEAALARGASELWLNAAPDGDPTLTYPLERARDYALSFKQQSACL